MTRLPLTYVLPIRRSELDPSDELPAYLRTLGSVVDEVIVVDASPDPVFQAHHAGWSTEIRHVRPDPDLRFANGKVNGVLTGVRLAEREALVIADDDVRYERPELAQVGRWLEDAEVVVPTNRFEPMPWHARWDTARTLLNRSMGHDWPGTLGIRRSALRHGYDGDVLFENLELIRTVGAEGGRVLAPEDLFVARRPPTVRRFLSQRVRQAYDDLAMPARLATFLALGPTVLALRRRPRALATLALGAIGLAEVGRRRGGGAGVFPATTPLFAPLWMAERAASSWLALGCRLVLGGCPYAGRIIRSAATSRRALRARARRAAGLAAAGATATRSPLGASRGATAPAPTGPGTSRSAPRRPA